jgi:alcohol oxidase
MRIQTDYVYRFPGDPSLVPVGQYFAVSAFSCYPYSRGSIHITGPEISDSPSFMTGFFSDSQNLDIKKHVWIYKKQREIVRRMDTYRGELAGFHPSFAASSDAALVELHDNPPKNVTNIAYTAEDDKIIEAWVRSHVETTWHSMGTSKMAPLKDGGVVDATLSVYGVENLKIADLSIPPLNVAANTANTAFAIGEKAADIFIEELCVV